MRSIKYSAVGLLFVSLMLGVSAGSDTLTKQPKKSRYTVIDVENGGSITGLVKYTGKVEASTPVEVTTTEDICHAEPIFKENLVVNSDAGVRWAVASIKNIKKGKPFPDSSAPEDQVKMNQIGCVFTPHVVVAQVGKNVLLLNDDGVLHNVHSWSKKNRSINIAMPGSVKEMKTKFRRAERIRVTCDVHPWMIGWFFTTENPYASVTAEDGSFSLTDIPPGTYTIELWHETLGTQEQTVTIDSGKATEIEFIFNDIPAQDD